MLFFISLQLISGWPMPSLLWLVIVYLLSNYVFSAFMFVCLEENIVKPYPELHFNITNATPVQYHYLLSWSINCTSENVFYDLYVQHVYIYDVQAPNEMITLFSTG